MLLSDGGGGDNIQDSLTPQPVGQGNLLQWRPDDLFISGLLKDLQGIKRKL